MRKRFLATALAFGLVLTGHAQAAFITNAAHSALAGGTVVNFDSLPNQTGSSVSSGGVILTGDQTVRIENRYIGDYNSRGVKYFDNGAGASNVISITFGTTVSAFGFLWGAADVNWTLSSYNAANVRIEQHVVSPTRGSNAGEFFGIAAAGIAKAELVSSNFSFRDWVFIDNLTFVSGRVAVPEPGTLALFGAGLLGLVAVRRRAGIGRA